MVKTIFGLLATASVELPFETPEKAAEAAKTNAEIAHLGVRILRAATDWGYRSYDTVRSNIIRIDPSKMREPRIEPVLFKSGDLVRIFKTVTDGDVCWSGKINIVNHPDFNRGMQTGGDIPHWASMFFDGLPAKLERDGKTVFGQLEPFCETGTEGIIWSINEYGKSGYDGLNCLRDGDALTVYNHVRDGEAEWEGTVAFDEPSITKLNWTEIMRRSTHMDTQKWMEMCWQNRPAAITPC